MIQKQILVSAPTVSEAGLGQVPGQAVPILLLRSASHPRVLGPRGPVATATGMGVPPLVRGSDPKLLPLHRARLRGAGPM